jgi:hypothetical protein
MAETDIKPKSVCDTSFWLMDEVILQTFIRAVVQDAFAEGPQEMDEGRSFQEDYGRPA